MKYGMSKEFQILSADYNLRQLEALTSELRTVIHGTLNFGFTK